MKCISIDLDGTLLNPQQELTKESLKTLKELQEKGYEVILNTGRAYKDVVKLEAVKNLDIPIFCINGSVLYSKTGDLL
ncbi:MAG TPA: HAD-IIB family hydrolase, partial [Chondromyces sp.]|nr:HAD-IIB family hydrolase [Chondromyces sp.]